MYITVNDRNFFKTEKKLRKRRKNHQDHHVKCPITTNEFDYYSPFPMWKRTWTEDENQVKEPPQYLGWETSKKAPIYANRSTIYNTYNTLLSLWTELNNAENRAEIYPRSAPKFIQLSIWQLPNYSFANYPITHHKSTQLFITKLFNNTAKNTQITLSIRPMITLPKLYQEPRKIISITSSILQQY